MRTCTKCARIEPSNEAKFCSACGAQHGPAKLPAIGVPAGRGIYRVTFPPQEAEFLHEDAVWDAVHHSAWNADREFKGEVRVEFVRSTVTVYTHPYECVNCKGTPNASVAEHTTGRCEFCDKANWQERKD